jgi:predicted nucleic-acid-binding Zn-ribbon protein
MNSGIKCIFCGTSTAELPAAEAAKVRCNVREFGAETFTVWRCAQCGSLHAREPIDYDRYYRDYPIHRLNYFFARSCYENGWKSLSVPGSKVAKHF